MTTHPSRTRIFTVLACAACVGCASSKGGGAEDSVPLSWTSGNPATGSGTTGPAPGALTSTGTPSTTTNVPGEWIDVSAGHVVTCGLRATGEAECWGFQLFFLQLEPPTPFVRVATESDRACGLDAAGGVECWSCIGVPDCGPPPGSYMAISSGSAGMCALAIGGTPVCWDTSDAFEAKVQTLPPGVLIEGEDTTVCVLPAIPAEPVCVSDPPEMSIREPPPGVEFIDVSIGVRHGCGLDSQGMASCWGQNSDETPYPQPPSPGPFVEIESSNGWDCALDAAGFATCWSDPDWFSGVTTDPPNVPFVHLSVGGRHACGLTAAGEIHCWGQDAYGETIVPP